MDTADKVIELHFALQGNRLPADHGYLLFSAISSVMPELHDVTDIGIHSLPGIRDGCGEIILPPMSKLRLRVPLARVPQLYSLSGKRLVIGGDAIVLGAPRIHMLRPAASLWSRLVLIKVSGSQGKFAEPESFLNSFHQQLKTIAPGAEARLEVAANGKSRDGFARRVLRVKGTTITGYGVFVDKLDDEGSLRLQSVGVGGRRKMGCGLFVPRSHN